ncbi:MAG TPA: hypothetical protein VD913_02005, partial [bacterium]|nr:hypothetical protein [bacterium]
KKQYRNQESASENPYFFMPQLTKIKKRLIKKDGYVVFFKKRQKWYTLTKTDLENHLPIVPVQILKDGIIYRTNADRHLSAPNPGGLRN